MKKYFKVSGIGIMAALIMAGCCSNEEMSESPQKAVDSKSKAITFSTYTPKSRTALTNSNITNYKFGVVGYNSGTGAPYFKGSSDHAWGTYGTMMEYKGNATGTWGNVYSSEAQEWPSTFSLNFIACAPIPNDNTEGITPLAVGGTTYGSGATFAASATEAQNALTIGSWIPPYTDVMYATAMNVSSPDARPAELTFKHLLTQLGSFNVKLLQTGYRVELIKVEILNVYTLGKITIPLVADPSTDATYPIVYSDKYNLPGTKLYQQLDNPQAINFKNTDPLSSDGSNGVSLLKDLNSFIIPPKASELWYYDENSTTAVGSKLALKLSIRVYKTAEGDSPEKLIFPVLTEEEGTTKTPVEQLDTINNIVYGNTWVPCVNKESAKDLQAGHRYTFNLNFKYTFGYTDGSDGQTPKPHYFDNYIKFTVNVDDWKEDVINITI